MDHRGKVRPSLPGCTPTPKYVRNSIVSNVYASRTSSRSKTSFDETNIGEVEENENVDKKEEEVQKSKEPNFSQIKASQLKAINRMIAKVRDKNCNLNLS